MDKTNKRKIRVVDDDDNLRTVLVDKLNMANFEAKGALNGKEGLKAALETHPDLILLDVMMPVMSGWDMLEKLREDEWGKTAKVMMLTVLEELDSVAKAVEKKALRYIVKTQNALEDIVEQVEGALAQSQ